MMAFSVYGIVPEKQIRKNFRSKTHRRELACMRFNIISIIKFCVFEILWECSCSQVECFVYVRLMLDFDLSVQLIFSIFALSNAIRFYC